MCLVCIREALSLSVLPTAAVSAEPSGLDSGRVRVEPRVKLRAGADASRWSGSVAAAWMSHRLVAAS